MNRRGIPEFLHSILPALFYGMKTFLRVFGIIGTSIFLSACFQKAAPFVLQDVNAAPDHLNERRLRFQGVPHLDKTGSYSWRGSSGGPGKPAIAGRKDWRYVVPITGSGWRGDSPVTLWVTFSTTKKEIRPYFSRLASALRSGTIEGKVIDFPTRSSGVFRGVSAWQQAVSDAEKRHGILSHPRAPIVIWDESM